MDDQTPPSDNPYDQILAEPDAPAAPAPSPSPDPSTANPYDQILHAPDAPTSGGFGSFMRGAARAVIPSAAGLAAAPAGAEAGAGIGAIAGGPFAEITAPVGALIGGISAMYGGSVVGQKAQDYAASQLPDSWQDSLEKQEKADVEQHPYASFLGGLAPYAITMSPGGLATKALPENATAFERLLANPVTSRLFGGTVQGGMELGNEYAEGGDIDWRKAAIATGFGMVFNKPNAIGETIHGAGQSVADAMRARLGLPDRPVPTVAQAGDAKVMGTGVNESVFQGGEQQHPDAQMVAQDAARAEQAATQPPPEPDLHAVARQMEPELFDQYDALSAQRDAFRSKIASIQNPPDEALTTLQSQREALEAQLAQVPTSGAGRNLTEARRLRAQIRDVQGQQDQLTGLRTAYAEGRAEETPETAQTRQHLMAVDVQMRDMGRDVAAAYRRAADAASLPTIPADTRTGTPIASIPERTPSLTDIIANNQNSPDAIAARATAAAADTSPGVHVVEGVPEPPATQPETAPLLSTAGLQNAPQNIPENIHASGRSVEQQRASISADIAHRLTAAGEPADRAEAAGKLLAARYVTRAARFEGKLGTAEDIYQREGPGLIGPRGGAPSLPAGGSADIRAPTGRAAAAPRNQGVTDFLARAGGLKDTGDLRAITGGENPFVPGAGRLIRPTGMSLDDALRAVTDAGFIHDEGEHGAGELKNDPRALLDLLDKEARGQKQYRQGQAPAPEVPESDAEKQTIETSARAELQKFGVDQKKIDAGTMARVVDMLYRREETDPLAAFEKAVMEKSEQHEAIQDARRDATGHLPGWDSPEARSAPGSGEAATRAEEGQAQAGEGIGASGGDARDAGFGDRAAHERLLDEAHELFQSARGSIKIAPGRRSIIRLSEEANASTFIHETGHQWLEELMQDAVHEAAPDSVKDDAQTVRDWLGNDGNAIKTNQHEKFARGFEQYMREGIAPSPALADVFARFKNWLTNIYQTLKGLGKPINDDIRGVFDRMLEMEPQRTVIAPERIGGPTLPQIHEADAALTEPHEAEPAADRIAAERERYVQEPPPEIQAELAAATARAQPATEDGGGTGGSGEVVPGGGGPGTEPGGSGVGARGGDVGSSGGEAPAKSASVSGTSERPGSPSTPQHALAPSAPTVFDAADSRFVDKAGNIVVSNLTSDQQLIQAIHESADRNQDFRAVTGRVTKGQLMDLAEDFAMEPSQLTEAKLGSLFGDIGNLAPKVLALRQAILKSAASVAEASRKANQSQSDEDFVAMAAAVAQHDMIQSTLAKVTNSWGRTGSAFHSLLSGWDQAKPLNDFLKENTGRTLFQMKRMAAAAAAIDTPQAMSKFVRDSRKTGFSQSILEYFTNNLISNPITHVTYSIGNTIEKTLQATVDTGVAAAIGRVREAMGREGERVHAEEIAAQLQGAARGLAPALQASIEALRTGQTTLLPGEVPGQATIPLLFDNSAEPGRLNPEATMQDAMASLVGMVKGMRQGIDATGRLIKAGGIEGAPVLGFQTSNRGAIPNLAYKGVDVLPFGDAARLPSRAVTANHSFFRSINSAAEMAALATRQAIEEGRAGDDRNARVAQLLTNPSQAMMDKANQSATDISLMGQGGEFTKRLASLVSFGFNVPGLGYTQPLRFIDPFVKISANITDRALLQRTPLGLLSGEIRADLLGQNGNVRQDQAQARMLVGSALAMTFGFMKMEGLISGSDDPDKNKAFLSRMVGNQAHSVRIGDFWYDVHRLGPMGMLMGVSADMYDVAHSLSEGEGMHAAMLLQHAIQQNVLDESALRGPSDLMKAIDDPTRYGESYIKSLASGFIPFSSATAQMARMMDPYTRESKTFLDGIRSRIPIWSEDSLPRRDFWGQPMPQRAELPGTSIYIQKMSSDPVNLAMFKLGVNATQLEKKIRNVTLTDQQYDDFSRIAGQLAKQRLDVIVNSPQFQNWPDYAKHDVMKETISQSREAARGVMMMKYPQISADATRAKRARITGETEQ